MIHARGLARTFTTGSGKKQKLVHAVESVDLDVSPGEIVGFLGPNGAGKTTTLRMLTTLLKPTSGTASVAGFNVATQPADVRRNIGYVSQAGGAFSQARAGEEVTDHGQLYGMTKHDAERRGKELFGALDLDGMWERQPRAMSGGQRRRLDIAMGLVHDPTLVFLDEPTTGLDPQARANLWEHIRDLRENLGATVFLTTHYLDEADALSDRIIIIDQGRIVAADTAAALKAQVAGDLVELDVTTSDVPATSAKLSAVATDVTVAGTLVTGRVPNAGREIPSLLRELDKDGISLTSLQVHSPTLDDVFLTMTGRTLRDSEGA